ncbi:hypothetical protein [Gayadomonas joobiniege]|uniref:hypothetical protein n=1 Tax=Gayadomonas joobiniege TaxID=1234606 RepID=UPI00036005DC|nr:hypothetical protein [Gayadomonas joobiniege]
MNYRATCQQNEYAELVSIHRLNIKAIDINGRQLIGRALDIKKADTGLGEVLQIETPNGVQSLFIAELKSLNAFDNKAQTHNFSVEFETLNSCNYD